MDILSNMHKWKRMKKVLALAFVTFAIAALVTSVVMMGTTQTANAQGKSGSAYGKNVIRPEATNGGPPWGDDVSDAADDDNDGSGDRSGDHGIGDFRADGCKRGQSGDNPGGVC
jgi:hypothetical protein